MARQREAERQVAQQRERRIKALYVKALSRYQQGAYEETAELLRQMALLDPRHPLVKTGERLIAQAELKRFESGVRSHSAVPSHAQGAVVSELEQLLTEKRMEIETAFRHAKAAVNERRYEAAMKLLSAILMQDPAHREARRLMEQTQLTMLREEQAQTERHVERDEHAMVNEVLRAELLPPQGQATVVPAGGRLASQASSLGSKLQEPVSFEFREVPLSDVLDFLADAAKVSIIPSPQLDLKARTVSLKATQLPLEQAIKYLTKSLSLAYRVDDDAILIASPEEFSNESLETRVFFLQRGLGPFTLETAALEPNPALAMQSTKELIEKTVPQPQGSKLVVDERSGAIIVTNTGKNLALVEQLLSQLDVTPVQVLIEARFVELTMTGLEHLALESILNGNVALTNKRAANETRGSGNELASGGGFKFPALARESEGLNLTLQGILTGTQFESVLHLLEETKKSKTLSAPRVTALNNQTALIRVVDEFRYPTRYEVSLIQFDINGDGDFDDAGETEFANVPQDIQKRDVGILLNVTPSVGKDLKMITLVLSPEVSQFSQFRDLGGGVTVPEFTSSQLTTSVILEDGQTAVLGGLMKDTTAQQVARVPVLGDLPLVGALFRQKEETSTRKNLLIFITARLLAPRGETT